MYRRVKDAVQGGLSLAFLGGNAVAAVSPLDRPSSQGRPHRILYMTRLFEGDDDAALLVGGRIMNPYNGSGNWTVTNAAHWIFEGTGMKNGDYVPGLVGWEHSGDPARIPGLEVVAAGQVLKANGTGSNYASTVYPGPGRNWIFNAATIFWNVGLSQPPGFVPPYSHLGRPHGVDERVQRITANFLARCGVRP